MPHQKRKARVPRRSHYARGARGASTPRAFAHPFSSTALLPFSPSHNSCSSPLPNASAFSLRQEARNTENHRSFWASDVQLRNQAIQFVSAGNLAGTLPEQSRSRSDTPTPHRNPPIVATPNETALHSDETISDAIKRSESALARLYLEPAAAASSSPASSWSARAVAGSPAPAVTRPEGPVRSTSPTPSNSSEEVVVFRGRNNVKPATDSSASASIAHPHHPHHPLQRKSESPDGAAVADYIQNVQAQEADGAGNVYETSTFTPRALGLTDSCDFGDEVDQPDTEAQSCNDSRRWDRESWQLEDCDSISTSSEALGKIDRILHKRERSTGLQYLVVFENSNNDEARWLPASKLTRKRDVDLRIAFDETVANIRLGNEIDSPESWSDASEEEESDDGGVSQRQSERMNDEDIARLFAKQEELGIDSHNLLLFDGDHDLDIDNVDDESRFTMPHAARDKKGQRPKPKAEEAHYPSASLVADVFEQDPYGGFDIIDFDRPSLRKHGRRTKRPGLSFDLSDSDLAAQLVTSWEHDRDKKRLKKQERAELRAQGWPGSTTNNKLQPDTDGMSFVQIQDELRAFLASPSRKKAFPPMHDRHRAALHQLAIALGCKSRSAGSGSSRFTTITKQRKAPEFDEAAFARITARYQTRFGAPAAGGGGGTNYAAASYRDGDVVGASAPEIGSDNKGRAMLEKMGWSSGTALGASNKGILQPVTHVVKTTKTGLK